MAKGGITIAVGVIAFVVAIAILGVSIAILINVTKKDKSSNDEPMATSRICPDIVKSSLPLATLPYAYDAYSWGTYRAPLYFGLRMRHEASPLFGLMWYRQPETPGAVENLTLHHYCEDDGVKCMWSHSDGKSFGRQPINSTDVQFQTDWLNQNHSWMARINVATIASPQQRNSFILYFALQDIASTMQSDNGSNTQLSISGTFSASGPYQLNITGSVRWDSMLSMRFEPFLDMGTINGFVRSALTGQCEGNLCFGIANDSITTTHNFAAVQFTLQAEATITITYRSLDDNPAQLPDFDTEFSRRMTSFSERFENIYHLQQNNYSGHFEQMGREAFANMIGAVSYWTGYCKVASDCLPYDQAIDYGPLTLFSAIPSRPYYPRGFLWDEGFHNLLIRRFDPELTLNIMASWLDMMDSEGWIPREVVLDSEAHIRAPPLLFEDHAVANPPMFIYLMDKLLNVPQIIQQYGDRLRLIYPRLKQQYIWLKTIQKGPIKGSFQWQGRNATTNLELNPGSTPSGLDDYPRATHPTKDEYHLDIRCWMSMCSRVMKKYCLFVGDNDWLSEVTADEALFNDLELLDQLHWSDSAQGYFDYGLHSFNVTMLAHPQPDGSVQWYRDVNEEPVLRLVTDVDGYVNIFPFVLRLLPADSPRLTVILRRLNNTEEMWTDFGLRSVSKKSRYYDAYNSEFAFPYWRGPIWININYLSLEALKYYASVAGANQQLARELYVALRTNVITNMANQYAATGFIWEHYDDKTGAGAGTRPFTGWSALVLAIMADEYD